MKINLSTKLKMKGGILILPLFKEDLNKLPKLDKEISDFIKNRTNDEKFDAKRGDTFATYLKNGKEKLVIIGFGSKKYFNATIARELGGKIGKHLKCLKKKSATVLLDHEKSAYLRELLEGMVLSLYTFDVYKTKAKNMSKPEEINFVVPKESVELKKQINEANLICDSVNYVRDLTNKPSHEVDPEHFALQAKKIAKENGYKITVFGRKELEKMGWGGLLAVSQGGVKEPKVVILEHHGAGKKEKPIVFVGKGISFDTGGYNLKPLGHIEDMHLDMAGAGVILGLFKVLKKLNIKKNVVGILVCTENLINEKAYRPSDVVKTLSGLTVEITNTDAEGRMILCDGLTYADKYNPELIISVATLTGAVAIALGERYAGLVANDLKYRKKLEASGRATDDLFWPMPLHKDFTSKMNSEIADLRNRDMGTSHLAGCSKGAGFLVNFVKKNKWCHIDLGGVAYTADPKEYETKGGTGHSLRGLIKFLQEL